MKPFSPSKQSVWGLNFRKRIFAEGLYLIRLLSEKEVDWKVAEQAGFHYREFYRWIQVFRRLRLPLRSRIEGRRRVYRVRLSDMEGAVRTVARPKTLTRGKRRYEK